MQNVGDTACLEETRDEFFRICRDQIKRDVKALLNEELQHLREEQERWKMELLGVMQQSSQRGKRASTPASGNYTDGGTHETPGESPPNYASEASSAALRAVAVTAGKQLNRSVTITKHAMQPRFAKTMSEDTREAEKAGCRWLSQALKCFSCTAALLLLIFLLSFFIWGLVKICKPADYMEIKSETMPWHGEMVLPQMAVSKRGDVIVRIEHCTIRNGDANSKLCLDVTTKSCKLGDHTDAIGQECMPPLSVAGTFGDTLYRYVAVKVFSSKGSNEGWISLWWEQRGSPTWTFVRSQLYSWSEQVPLRSEIYFEKVTALQGESFGLFGRSGNDESEQLLEQKDYMVKESEYSYAGKRNDADSQGLILGRALYLRAAYTKREDFYEVYSLLRLLEAMGGLYTSLSFILFIPMVFAYKLIRHSGLLTIWTRPLQRLSHRLSGRAPKDEVPVEELKLSEGEEEGGSPKPLFSTVDCSQQPVPEAMAVVPETSHGDRKVDVAAKSLAGEELPGMLLT